MGKTHIKQKTKGIMRPLGNKNRKRHSFPQLVSPGNGGTTGITMDTQHLKQKEPADRRGKEGEEEE